MKIKCDDMNFIFMKPFFLIQRQEAAQKWAVERAVKNQMVVISSLAEISSSLIRESTSHKYNCTVSDQTLMKR